jgi:pantoate ligase/cytidylate kinase
VRLLRTVEGLACWRQQIDPAETVGLVPTMGALHRGHLSLIEQARRVNDHVVVSIFVNPLQFGPTEDLDRYPRTLDADQGLCQQAGVDVIFMPTARVLYGSSQPQPTALNQVFPPLGMMEHLCGVSRPGHFQGVATVVTKLFNLVQPDRAYFGQKDGQQLAIIRQLVQDLNLPVEVVGCPIVREADGLAMSSRNQYLNGQDRQQAAILYRGLRAAEKCFQQGVRSHTALTSAVRDTIATAPAVTLEYVELVHPDTLDPLETLETLGMLAIAARVGNTRLIDNVIFRTRQPIIAIDGPAGAGKSTVARQLAHRLELLYLDTGAMYRAFTWFVLSQGVAPQDEVAVAELLSECQIRLMSQVTTPAQAPAPPEVWVNDRQVTQAIRRPDVTAQVSVVAAQAAVRAALVEQQKQYGLKGGVVADGRDIGTHVFPHAELKIFLTASVQERARRRLQDLATQSQPLPTLSQLEADISERDRKDSTRQISPLRKAEDAIEIITDDLSVEAVIEQIIQRYQTVKGSVERG